jgi:hypothetical protein
MLQKSVSPEKKLYIKRLCNSLLFLLSYTTSCPQEISKGKHVTRPFRRSTFILLPSPLAHRQVFRSLCMISDLPYSRSKQKRKATVRRVVTAHSKHGMKFISCMSDIIQCLSLFNESSPKQ